LLLNEATFCIKDKHKKKKNMMMVIKQLKKLNVKTKTLKKKIGKEQRKI